MGVSRQKNKTFSNPEEALDPNITTPCNPEEAQSIRDSGYHFSVSYHAPGGIKGGLILST